MVTARDLEILKLLEAHGLATARQISNIYFPSVHTGRNRIKSLLKLGVIKKLNYNSIFDKKEFEADQCLSLNTNDCFYSIGDLLSKLRKTVIHKDLINHNLLCNDVLIRIKSIIGSNCKSFSFEKFDKNKKNEIAPDITMYGENYKLGIEVERTLKRDSFRYIHKFTHYSQSDYTHILYVCKSSEIYSEIFKLSRQFPFVGATLLTYETDVSSHKIPLTDFLARELNI